MTEALSEASRAQIAAAAPGVSTWLSANAGSGKTRVLTDRVARLLLDGVPPERILCLTYTKAAAMEMQNRLFSRLGEWAMKDDAALRGALAAVGADRDLDAPRLARARTLFARAIETPGGLKIQTIHSFCAAVLRRFPLEARITPGFTEIDERVQRRLIGDVIEAIARDPVERDAIDGVAPHLGDEDGLLRLAQAVAGQADALSPPWSWEAICGWAGIAPDLTVDDVVGKALLGDEGDLALRVLPHLEAGSRSTGTLHAALSTVRWDAPRITDLATLEGALLFGSGTKSPFSAKIDGVGNKSIRAAIGDAMAPLNELALRLEATRPLRLALFTAQRTAALHRFAGAFLPAYRAAKDARGWLDFDDLITRTRALLSDAEVAQWVLFRLDGGIDHILVDEAQDTSPAQWEIVKNLAADFAAGAGARADVARTIFVVGDKKQSIYSFQGADPAGFDRMREHFRQRLEEIDAPFAASDLVFSFRSAPPILALVDAVAASAGRAGVGPDVAHRAFFGHKPGRIDLWPVVEKSDNEDPPDWEDPQDLIGADHHVTRLARALAERIKAMIADGEPITDGDTRRAVTAGDILILVQSRSSVFRPIISALKIAGLPVAGVDRAQIDEPLAVKDLIALMRFLATPEDDLSLACILRSPLAGWDEAALFDLAHGRPGYLWRALQGRQADRPGWSETARMLEDLRNKADFMRPYDLLERVLIRWDGRRRLIARLGAEAEDGIDAVLAQALAYERMEVPSVTGFVGWLEAGDVVVKRDLAQARGQIRVMTVHGAKGLEAPVVVLPDCARRIGRGGGQTTLVTPEGGPLVWPGAAADAVPTVAASLDARKAADTEERNRLLYVAMTRAESWLIVAAAGDAGSALGSSWYNAIDEAMRDMPATPYAPPELEGAGLRWQTGDWSRLDRPEAPPAAAPDLPDWAHRPAPPGAERDLPALSPSDLGGAKALPGEGEDTRIALRRGRLIHLLLEHLPQLPEAAWEGAAPDVARMEDASVSPEDFAPLLSEARAVLTLPSLAPIFGKDTLAEVQITGDSAVLGAPVLGVIDRLIVTPTRVLAVDFKSNRVVPGAPEDVPEGILRQLGAYSEILAQIYPDRTLEVAVLWTRTAMLMTVPLNLAEAALRRAAV